MRDSKDMNIQGIDDDTQPVTDEEITMVKKVRKLHKRGSDAVVKCKKDGVLAVYEVTKTAV